MSNICYYCGKKVMIGRSISHADNRTRRVFHPNIQKVRAVVENKVKRIKICTKCIKAGKLVKPPKHKLVRAEKVN